MEVLGSCMDSEATSFIRSLCPDKGLGVMLCNPGVWHPHFCSAQSLVEKHNTHMCWAVELEPWQWQGPQAEQVLGGRTRDGEHSRVAFCQSVGVEHFPRFSHHGSSSKCSCILVIE
jgi:hypothetical protein